MNEGKCMIDNNKIAHYKDVIQALRKTKELIYYSIQLTNAVHTEVIRPEFFEARLRVPELNNTFDFVLDWKKLPPFVFKEITDDIQVVIGSYAMIVSKEIYPKDLWVTKDDINQDLYVAQTIQKLVRDAFAHIVVNEDGKAQAKWDMNESYRKLYVIKGINLNFDATNLHGEFFKFSHLGGLGKYLEILDILILDLENRIKKFK